MKFKHLIFCCVGVQSLFAAEVSIDYLLWKTKQTPIPVPFVTTVSYSDPVPGALGQPGSHVKMGDTKFNLGWQSGFQAIANTGIGTECKYGIEGIYFLLPKATKKKALSTSGLVGSPSYAVPIFDVTGFWGLNGIPGETIYLLPGPLLGTDPGFDARFQLKASSTLQGAQLNGLYKCNHIDVLMGFRWISLHESLRFNIQSKSVPGFPGPASFFNSRDRFTTTNNFLGAQIGLQARFGKHRWHLDGSLKGGVGAMLEKVHVQGSSISPGGNLFYLVTATVPQQISGGVFAQPTNIGRYHQTQFAGVLETLLRASYCLNRYFALNVAYDFLWISKLARPGDQMDRKINPTLTGLAAITRSTTGTRTDPTPFGMPGAAQAPQGPKRPHFSFETTDFWAQGLNIGLAFYF